MHVFDIVGPIMIGPSSSHTAGAARIGRAARMLLGEAPARAQIVLYGSFAKTYRGHGTDKALAAGIMGMLPDDAKLRESLRLAEKEGLSVEFSTDTLDDSAHPNTVRVTLTGKSGRTVWIQGASVGGGNILITQVNGMQVEITGQHATLIVLHQDAPGTIAEVTEYISRLGANICNFRLSRAKKGGTAVMTIEVDGGLAQSAGEEIQRMANVLQATLLQPN